MKEYKENKIFYLVMLIIVIITLFLILLVHIFNTSSEIDEEANILTCPALKQSS